MTVDIIGWAAILAAVISFAVWVVGTFRASAQANNLTAKVAKTETPPVGDQHGFVAGPSISELTELFRALSAAIDALWKAGPGLVGIGASVLFLGIAAWTVATPTTKKPQVCSITKNTAALFADNKVAADIPVTCKDAP